MWRSIDRIDKVEEPILFITGIEDRIVPSFMSVELKEKATNAAYTELFEIENLLGQPVICEIARTKKRSNFTNCFCTVLVMVFLSFFYLFSLLLAYDTGIQGIYI